MPPPTGFDASQYASPAEVAAAWKVSAEAVRRLCRAGRIDGAIQIADRPGPGARLLWHIPRSHLTRYPLGGAS
jgi:hypothetical protein